MSSSDDAAPDLGPGVLDLLLRWQRLEASSRRVRERYAHEAAINLVDFQAMVLLSSRGEMAVKAMSGLMNQSSGATTALVDRLQDAGYVQRKAHPADRRSLILSLTAEGQAATAAAGGCYARAVRDVLPAEERGDAARLFEELANALDAEIEA